MQMQVLQVLKNMRIFTLVPLLCETERSFDLVGGRQTENGPRIGSQGRTIPYERLCRFDDTGSAKLVLT